ncbi:MAG: hypothetical protein ACKVYV_01540 [Limisphaerales bacterium]
MNFAGARTCTLAAGVSGSGKTTFALKALVNGAYTCRFIVDPEGEYAVRLRLRPAATTEACENALASRWVIFDPGLLWPGRYDEAFAWFCGYALETSNRGAGRKILMVDEVWRYCDPHRLPAELATCIQTGRRYGLDVMFATQRPNRLNEAITNEVTELVCFRLQGSNALRVVSDMGVNEAEVSALVPGAYVARNLVTGGELRGRVF